MKADDRGLEKLEDDVEDAAEKAERAEKAEQVEEDDLLGLPKELIDQDDVDGPA